MDFAMVSAANQRVRFPAIAFRNHLDTMDTTKSHPWNIGLLH